MPHRLASIRRAVSRTPRRPRARDFGVVGARVKRPRPVRCPTRHADRCASSVVRRAVHVVARLGWHTARARLVHVPLPAALARGTRRTGGTCTRAPACTSSVYQRACTTGTCRGRYTVCHASMCQWCRLTGAGACTTTAACASAPVRASAGRCAVPLTHSVGVLRCSVPVCHTRSTMNPRPPPVGVSRNRHRRRIIETKGTTEERG
jgi:hypothetical protein